MGIISQSEGDSTKSAYMLQCHVTRIREALQAVSAEKRKNGPASLGCPAAGAPGLPSAGHGLQASPGAPMRSLGGVLSVVRGLITEPAVQGVSCGCCFSDWCNLKPFCRSYRGHGGPVWRTSGAAMLHRRYSLAPRT